MPCNDTSPPAAVSLDDPFSAAAPVANALAAASGNASPAGGVTLSAQTPDASPAGGVSLTAQTPDTAAPTANSLSAQTPDASPAGGVALDAQVPSTAAPTANSLAAQTPDASPAGGVSLTAQTPSTAAPTANSLAASGGNASPAGGVNLPSESTTALPAAVLSCPSPTPDPEMKTGSYDLSPEQEGGTVTVPTAVAGVIANVTLQVAKPSGGDNITASVVLGTLTNTAFGFTLSAPIPADADPGDYKLLYTYL